MLEKREGFIEPEVQKLTKIRLRDYLFELGVEYKTVGEGSNYEIIIDIPEEFIIEKQKLVAISVLNSEPQTEFDEEKIMPLFRKINYSTNSQCELGRSEDGSQYIFSVSKKQ